MEKLYGESIRCIIIDVNYSLEQRQENDFASAAS